MRVAIAQINPTLGRFENNKDKILEYIDRATQKKSELVIFPECALFGYHPFDLLERSDFVEQQEKLVKTILKSLPANVAVVFGLITKNNKKLGRPYFNSAVFLVKGKAPKYFHKQILPTGDVFDEARFIEPGHLKKNFFKWKGRQFFLSICEDIWAWPDQNSRSVYSKNPLSEIKSGKVDLVINLSASPFFVGKSELREKVAKKTAQKFKAPLVYANLVGSQDEIIFDGASFVLDSKGSKVATCLQFQEDLNIFDLDSLESWNPSVSIGGAEELRSALVFGIRDFCKKVGISRVHFGLSGGIDSAVVACLAADAIGPGNVSAIALPGPFNIEESLGSAKSLSKNLGIEFKVLGINDIYTHSIESLNHIMDMSEFSIVNENLQARIRGFILMAFANKYGSLLLNTGNKTEFATGYCTLYGDMCGGLSPIGDLTKDQIYLLAEHYNSQAEIIPRFIISRPPSAELRPNQVDQDSLPPYAALDRAVVKIVEKCEPAVSKTEKWLEKRLFQTEFKRWQAPPILKVSSHSFGRGRRFPIAVKLDI